MTAPPAPRIERYAIEVAVAAHFSHLVPDRFVAPLAGLREVPLVEGEPLAYAVDTSGKRHAIVVRGGGGIQLAFDLVATLESIRTETYPGADLGHPIVSRIGFDYTRLPMWMISLAARILRRPVDLASLPPHPSYPIDCSADLIAGLARGDMTAPPMAWPGGKRYAVALSHDVDTDWLFRHPRWLTAYCDVEEASGMRSAWYVVPKTIESAATRPQLASLVTRGHEIGVHGFDHDARLADLPEDRLAEKLAQSRTLLADYLDGPPGYRAPWLSRSSAMYRALFSSGYLYDTSAPCADFQRGNAASNNGCGTLFPFRRESLLVLPITLPQDSMASSVGRSPQRFWEWIFELIGQVKDRGGLAMITTHLQPHHSASAAMQEGYRRLLSRLAEDGDAWVALPRDVARHVSPKLPAPR